MRSLSALLLATLFAIAADETGETIHVDHEGEQTHDLRSEHADKRPKRVECRHYDTGENTDVRGWRYDGKRRTITLRVPKGTIGGRRTPNGTCTVLWAWRVK